MTAVTPADLDRDDPPEEPDRPEPDRPEPVAEADRAGDDPAPAEPEAGAAAGPDEPGDGSDVSDVSDGSDGVGSGAGGRRRLLHGHRLTVVLVVAALLLGGAGAWFAVEARAVRATPSAQNSALVDTGTTAEVSAAITSSLNRVFSYSYDNPSVTEQAAAQVLRGPALETYNRLFAQVREQAPQQKIVLSTRVVNIAVQSLTGDRAELLVFLDQSATRADNNTTSTGAAQLSVTAQRQDGTWVIIDLTPR